jgi:hypothetical protein
MKKAIAEARSQCLDGYQEALVARLDGEPSASVRSERATGHEHVQMGMPLERAGPGVQDGECSDLTAHKLRVCAQRGEGVESRSEQDWEQRLLVRAELR